MLTLPQRLGDQSELYLAIMKAQSVKMRVAAPGIIQSFNPTTQTAVVQLAIRERLNIDGNLSWEEIPLLVDVPVCMPRAGGYMITFPITAGDECLVIFSDFSFDAWWQSGGIQNQAEQRRHDLSDGFALMGIWSQPRRVTNYSTTSAQLRTEDGATVIDVKPGEITHTATKVTINSHQVTIAGKDFLAHTHSGVQAGSGNTGAIA